MWARSLFVSLSVDAHPLGRQCPRVVPAAEGLAVSCRHCLYPLLHQRSLRQEDHLLCKWRPSQRLPVVVSVLGSGAYSNFIQRNGQILDAHRTQREVFGTKAHVLIVEKPGVEFLEQHPNQGTSVEGSLEFRREHTLERWSEAVSAALRAARSLPLADQTKSLLIGHSEGGITVARVAAEN